METIVEQIASLIRAHQAWAGPLIGLVAFGESMVLIGLFVPGTAVLLLAGGLIGSGLLHPLPVLICGVIGASLGDAVSYFVGVGLGRGVVHKWPLNQYVEGIARARPFFRQYGFATIFFGRFFGPVRSAIPLVAGMMGMDGRRFQLANALSAMLWVPALLSPGWLIAKGAGKYLELSESDWLSVGIGAIVVAVVALGVGVTLFRRAAAPRRARIIRRHAPAETL